MVNVRLELITLAVALVSGRVVAELYAALNTRSGLLWLDKLGATSRDNSERIIMSYRNEKRVLKT